MIEGEVTSRRALRDAYREKVEDLVAARRFDVSGAELDGVPVVSVKELEEGIVELFGAPPPGAPDGFAEVETPAAILVHAECPRCGIAQEVSVTLGAVLTVDTDGAELSVKAKSKARPHVCGQLPIMLNFEGKDVEQTSIDFDAIVGPTREELVVIQDAPDPGDIVVSDVEDYCAAEAEIPEEASPTGTVVLVCGRPIDHADDHFVPATEAPARPAIAWHYETVPVEAGISGDLEPTVVRDMLLLVLSTKELGEVPLFGDRAEDEALDDSEALLRWVETWSASTRGAVAEWASAVHLVASDHDDVTVPTRPGILDALDQNGGSDGAPVD